eukprot:TRINITY_DN631_c0_g1_i5.p4 TRINITY_DN631_c0_g1~~TRINITY_DN631_c0_g1_i5.p4  ORF type:complete len:119 (-),score=0.93 TRINITY_DN631_c0_g1_i5:342-698(-)
MLYLLNGVFGAITNKMLLLTQQCLKWFSYCNLQKSWYQIGKQNVSQQFGTQTPFFVANFNLSEFGSLDNYILGEFHAIHVFTLHILWLRTIKLQFIGWLYLNSQTTIASRRDRDAFRE